MCVLQGVCYVFALKGQEEPSPGQMSVANDTLGLQASPPPTLRPESGSREPWTWYF